MHELSLAYNMVEIASQAARDAQAQCVVVLHVRVGALSGVVKDALLFGYEIAAEGTILEGSRLEIEEVPVVIYCPTCAQEMTLPTIQSLACPVCGTLSADIRQGKELDIVSLEVTDEQPAYP
jgi:hydrogenase nickel incorporation protein HypA/HybF